MRRASADDASAISEVHRRSIRGLCAGDYSPAEIPAWTAGIRPALYRRAMGELREELVVAEAGTRILGFAALRDDELRALYVHPRCASRGIGTRLLRAMERRASSRGVRVLRCTASLTARTFYLARGWRTLRRTIYESPRGFRIPAVRMVRSLARTAPGPGALP